MDVYFETFSVLFPSGGGSRLWKFELFLLTRILHLHRLHTRRQHRFLSRRELRGYTLCRLRPILQTTFAGSEFLNFLFLLPDRRCGVDFVQGIDVT